MDDAVVSTSRPEPDRSFEERLWSRLGANRRSRNTTTTRLAEWGIRHPAPGGLVEGILSGAIMFVLFYAISGFRLLLLNVIIWGTAGALIAFMMWRYNRYAKRHGIG